MRPAVLALASFMAGALAVYLLTQGDRRALARYRAGHHATQQAAIRHHKQRQPFDMRRAADRAERTNWLINGDRRSYED